MPSLPPNTLHIWLIESEKTDLSFAQGYALLPIDEQERANRFYFAKDREAYVLCRAMLRQRLASYMNHPPAAITFNYNLHGKPFVQAPQTNICFNMSHSHGMLLLGFAQDSNLGVDIEKIRPDVKVDEIAARFFSKTEIEALRNLPESEKIEGFFKTWAQKEAFIKAMGEGLSYPLNRFSVNTNPKEMNSLVSIDEASASKDEWTVLTINAPTHYKAACIIQGKDWQIEYQHPG